MTKRIIKLVSVMSVLFLISACGQKGPLYMPPERETTDPDNESAMPATELPSVGHQVKAFTAPDDQ